MERIEGGNKIPKVDMQDEDIDETPSPYKAGIEEILKFPAFQVFKDSDYKDNDYGGDFKKWARIILEIRKRGETTERILIKARLELKLRNFRMSVSTTKRAEVLSPEMEEVHFEEGLAIFLLAAEKAGVITGMLAVEDSVENSVEYSVRDLLQQARDCFTRALELDSEDEDVKNILQKLTALLEVNTPEEEEPTN